MCFCDGIAARTATFCVRRAAGVCCDSVGVICSYCVAAYCTFCAVCFSVTVCTDGETMAVDCFTVAIFAFIAMRCCGVIPVNRVVVVEKIEDVIIWCGKSSIIRIWNNIDIMNICSGSTPFGNTG